MSSGGLGSDVSGSSQVAPSGVSHSKPSRSQRKIETMRQELNLDASEPFLEDYLCAVRKKVLKPGRMYVFEKHIGFHSNTFGYHKYRVIPIKDITRVVKESNVGFPNSILVEWGSQSIFFTSFLNREDAYRLILQLWRQLSSRAPSRDPSPCSSDDDHLTSITRPVKKLLTSVGLTRGSGPSLSTATGGDSEFEDESVSRGRQRSSGSNLDSSDDEFVAMSDAEFNKSTDLSFAEAEGAAPPVEEGLDESLSYTLDCSPEKFWKTFLSNDSKFFMDFHLSRGDSSIKLTKWQQHAKVGMVRDMQFVTPVKVKMGPDSTLCCQTQRFTVHAGQHLVFQTSQTMNDIPYSDHFTVDSRWDITRVDGKSSVKIYIQVPFIKKTMWKKFIEKGVRDGCLSSFVAWRDMAKDWLAGKKLSPSKRPKAAAATAAQGQVEGPNEPSEAVHAPAKSSGLFAALLGGLSSLPLSTVLLAALVAVQLAILMQLRQAWRIQAEARASTGDSPVLQAMLEELRALRLKVSED